MSWKRDEEEARRGLHPGGRQHPAMRKMWREDETILGSRGESRERTMGKNWTGEPGSLCSTPDRQRCQGTELCSRFRKGLPRLGGHDVFHPGSMWQGLSLISTNKHRQYLGSKRAGEGPAFRKRPQQSPVCPEKDQLPLLWFSAG